jgi:predicted transcriptional regulator
MVTTEQERERARASEADLSELPARLRAIAATIGQMVSDGYSKQEIATYYGKSRPWVSARLRELEQALEDLLERRRRELGRR